MGVHFRLIDCGTRTIVPATLDYNFVVLSYVWGPQNSARTDRFPDRLPPTVADAMSITLELGFRYLWVDRYCIDQEDAADKAVQIGQMEKIYGYASATIVAAAGKSPSFGIPGAGTGSVSRKTHASGKVSGHHLISTFKDPQRLIKDSEWMTRGWTYQEAMLSQRLLIFTEEQLYFECTEMQCCEAAEYTISPRQPVNLFSQKHPWSVFEAIEDYSARSLSHDSDALNGLLGILKAYQNQSCPIYIVWGNPIPSVPLLISDQHEEKQFATLSQAFAMGMYWTTKAASNRRAGFPSWSWGAWKGLLYHYIARNDYCDANITRYIEQGWKVQVEVEGPEKSISLLEDFQIAGGLTSNIPVAPHIWMTSYTIPLTIVPFPSFMPDYFSRTTPLDPEDRPNEEDTVDASVLDRRTRDKERFKSRYLFTVKFRIMQPKSPHTYAYIPLIHLDNKTTHETVMTNCFGILCCPSTSGFFNVGMKIYPVIIVQKIGDVFERIGCFTPCNVSMIAFESEEDEVAGLNPEYIDLYHLNDGLVTDTKTEYMSIKLA